MIVFAREVFVCTCSTRFGAVSSQSATSELRFRRGEIADIARLDPVHHGDSHREELHARLERGEYWLIGDWNGHIATYTWLHDHNTASYPSLPGCVIQLDSTTGYGYDAWTPPHLRGHGFRRRAFAEELRVLGSWGLDWEASFFVKHQLIGATRSLATAGIEVVPQWRISLTRDRSLRAEQLHPNPTVRPSWTLTSTSAHVPLDDLRR